MDENLLKFEEIKKDIVEFMECSKKCILPHNELMYNIILNAIEMMIVRMEYDGADNIKDVICSYKEDDETNNEEKLYDTSKLPENVKQEIDDIIKDVLEK